MDPRLFFPVGAPPFAPSVQDDGLKLRIHKTIEFAARSGPKFLEEVRSKQGHNPEYAFLYGGEGSAYFQWALYCQLLGRPPTQPLPPPIPLAGPQLASFAQPAQAQNLHGGVAPPPTSSPSSFLSPETRSGWLQVLSLLVNSRDSITRSAAWFTSCSPTFAPGLAELTMQRLTSLTEYEPQLHIIYLVNDILFKAQARRPPGSAPSFDPIASAFQPFLGTMLQRVYQTAGGDAEKQQNLLRIVQFWSERGIYLPTDVEIFVMHMMGINQNMQPPGTAAPLPLQQSQQRCHQAPPPPQAMPLQMQSHQPWQMQMQQPPPPRLPPPPPSTEPEKPPFDPMSFPPGLIPKLVEEKLRTEAPYTPLTPDEIEECQVPPPPQMDDYLKARLDKFYAQLTDYRPGMSFGDIEGELPRQHGFSDRELHHPHTAPINASIYGDDGSAGFRGLGSGGGGARGLGYGNTHDTDGDGDNKNDDVFASYRRMRSMGYHGGISMRSGGGKGRH